MKYLPLQAIAIFALTSTTWASGGLSIDSVEKHMNANSWAATESEPQNIVVQAPVDRFDVKLETHQEYFVDTNQLKHNYDGQS